MGQWDQLADDAAIQTTITALSFNGINTHLVNNGQQAKELVIKLIPSNSEVMNMTSMTLESTSISEVINKSDNFSSVKNKLNQMNRPTQNLDMQKLGAAPEYAVGSVHAVTQQGQVLIASNTGSQLPAYAYGSPHVIWVVSTKKIVSNLEDGIQRIYEYSLPKEADRARKAYGTGSAVNKILIINAEVTPDRINLIFCKRRSWILTE